MVQLPLRERPVMSRLYLWSPLLLLSWPPLWLLVQVAQASDWALDHVPLTSDPPGLTSERSLDSPHVLAPSAEPGGLAYSTASSPAQMFAPPSQEVTETFVPDPDLDSAGELPARPDHFSVDQQHLNDRLRQHQNFPEVPLVLGWDQSQGLVLPVLQRKVERVGPDQAEDHQLFAILVPPLGSKSSKPSKFVVSPPN